MGTRLNPKQILELVEREGFEKAWIKTADLLPKGKRERKETIERGKTHIIFDLIQQMREKLIELGFTEVLNPTIIEEKHIYRQYGPEASIILDRCYYLATLPRPEIGLSKEKQKLMEELGLKLTNEKVETLKSVLRDYKRGVLSSEDLREKIAIALEIDDSKVTELIDKVFPEFLKLKPVPTTLTLRSHITSAWFETLSRLQFRLKLPIKLFSVDIKFRREQQEDETHLRSSRTASCVWMDEDVVEEDGIWLVKEVLSSFGIDKIKFVKKKVTSRYYAPGTEYEVYAYHPKADKWIEVANLGMYSPIALARYKLVYPVLNVGMGVERIGMIICQETDIRRLAYPQFYAEWIMSDEEIAKMISIDKYPVTQEGKEICSKIIETALLHKDSKAPCEFKVFEGELFGRKVSVSLYERDAGEKLIGPASLNEIYVYDGNILGIPPRGFEETHLVKEAREKGVKTKITPLYSIASLASYEIEKACMSGRPKEINIRVRIAKSLKDINVRLDELAKRYILSKRKKIEVGGPIFVGIFARLA